MTVIRNNTRVGSSPRVRGTFSLYRVLSVFLGLIPAGAGNMRMKIITNGGSRAHPRGCGEHEEGMPGVCLPGGSSPRVRGTCSTRNVERSSRGLIPAGAGNILVIATDPITRMGSSPRVRGTFRVIQNTNHHRGLIPAGAGNMSRNIDPYDLNGAHPRGCGEHPSASRSRNAKTGSSPRVRGTYFLTWGFTPIPQVLVLV